MPKNKNKLTDKERTELVALIGDYAEQLRFHQRDGELVTAGHVAENMSCLLRIVGYNDRGEFDMVKQMAAAADEMIYFDAGEKLIERLAA